MSTFIFYLHLIKKKNACPKCTSKKTWTKLMEYNNLLQTGTGSKIGILESTV